MCAFFEYINLIKIGNEVFFAYTADCLLSLCIYIDCFVYIFLQEVVIMIVCLKLGMRLEDFLVEFVTGLVCKDFVFYVLEPYKEYWTAGRKLVKERFLNFLLILFIISLNSYLRRYMRWIPHALIHRDNKS